MGKRPRVSTLPAPGEGKRGTEGYLGYLLRQAANAYRHRADRALADLGITPPQFSVLIMLSAYPGYSNADLARLALLTPQTVSVIVGNLLKAGLIERHPHAVHGRIQQLDLTPQGSTLLSAARDRMNGIETELTRGLSKAEERTVREWLVAVAVAGPEA